MFVSGHENDKLAGRFGDLEVIHILFDVILEEVSVCCGYLAQSAGWAPCFCATALAWNQG